MAVCECGARREPGYIELGVEQTVLICLWCPVEALRTEASIDLSEGPGAVARRKVLSIVE